VPAVAQRSGAAEVALVLPEGMQARVPRAVGRLARHLAVMADFARDGGRALAALEALGIVGPQELPAAVVPEAPRALDGWDFS
jgi:hypothetical protein